MGVFQVGIFRVGVILGGNFLWWGFSSWELSGGNHPGRNFPCGSFPSTLLPISHFFYEPPLPFSFTKALKNDKSWYESDIYIIRSAVSLFESSLAQLKSNEDLEGPECSY